MDYNPPPMSRTRHQSRRIAPGRIARRAIFAMLTTLALLGPAGCNRSAPDEPPAETSSPASTAPPAPPATPVPTSSPATTTTTPPTTAPAQTDAAAEPPAPVRSLSERVAEASIPPDDPTTLRFAGLVAPKPAAWQWRPPENALRLANFIIPATSGASQAHLAVFAAEGDGPTIVRGWEKRFRTEHGDPGEATLSKMDVDGRPILIVELAGEYMKAGHGWYTSGQRLLGALLQTPEGPVQIRLLGPDETIQANRDAFFALLQGIRADAPANDDAGLE